MEIMKLILIIFACVIASSVIGKFVQKVALPLIQILVGFVIAMLVPAINGISVSSDLFLMLFIAPLLFNEARTMSKKSLWENKGAIASLAIGLVLATIFVTGWVMNLVVPTMPLAAAFAFAAAIAPTDATAVDALGSRVGLQHRERALLNGESLMNDAAGVVSFQFAIAAVVTGSFSALDASESFLIQFFGGIALGVLCGAIALLSMKTLRHFGYEDTVVHVLYEVFTPFLVFMLSEWIGVSGILAVVAAGLVISEPTPKLLSVDAAKRETVSNNFWRVIVFLINGIIFTMLGMQLPNVFYSALAERYSVLSVIGLSLLGTGLVLGCRMLWLLAMEIIHSAKERKKGWIKSVTKSACVMTLSGPKGAITLSVVFTIPMFLNGGGAFPERDLLIVLAANVILITLLLANFVLPVLAPKKSSANDKDIHQAIVIVLEATIKEIKQRLDSGNYPEYTPALSAALAKYQSRLVREQVSNDPDGAIMNKLSAEVLKLQQKRAEELQVNYYDKDLGDTIRSRLPYYEAIRNIRASLGYHGQGMKVGSRFHNIFGRIAMAWSDTDFKDNYKSEDEKVYYDACIFAIELEHVALNYLQDIIDEDNDKKRAAEILHSAHIVALNSLWGRINYGQDFEQKDTTNLDIQTHEKLPSGMKPQFKTQLIKALRYSDEVDATVLSIELDNIRHLSEKNEISPSIAHELRQRVYAMQMYLDG